MRRRNPYRFEISFAYIAGPLVMALELWRRWGDFANPAFWDDYFYFTIAIYAAYLLSKRKYSGQLLWLYACGIGTFMIWFSLFFSLHTYSEGDVSGIAMPYVIAFKLTGSLIIGLMSVRAFNFLRHKPRFPA